MSVTQSRERSVLKEDEAEVVRNSRYPHILHLGSDKLSSTMETIRQYRDKAREQLRSGKGKPAGGESASLRERVFAKALKRLNRERQRWTKNEKRVSQSDIAREALDMKRANRVRHHPSSGRTPDEGMTATPVAPGYAGPPRTKDGAPGP